MTHGRPALLKVSPLLAFKDAFPGGSSSPADKARVGLGSSASGRTPAVGTAFLWVFPLLAQTVKRLPTVRERRVRSLGQEGPLRRKWPPTSVLLTGKSHGPRSLVGYSPWGRKESDTTERLDLTSLLRGRLPGWGSGQLVLVALRGARSAGSRGGGWGAGS